MAGKSSPALFELIRDPEVIHKPKVPAEESPPAPAPQRSAATPAEHGRSGSPPLVEGKPVRVVVPVPEGHADAVRPGPAPVEAPSRTGGGGAPALSSQQGWNRPLTFSVASVCIAVAAVFVALIVVSATAYRAGYATASEEAVRELRATAAPLADPLHRDAEPRVEPQPPPRLAERPVTAPPAQVTEPRGRVVVVPPEADPRQSGLNYYAIVGQLDRESAERIAGFLAENGLEALAVESSRRGSNNPRYRVLGLKGLTGEELRTPARAEYERRISQLGQVWRRDHRGWTDFSDAYWERFGTAGQ